MSKLLLGPDELKNEVLNQVMEWFFYEIEGEEVLVLVLDDGDMISVKVEELSLIKYKDKGDE